MNLKALPRNRWIQNRLVLLSSRFAANTSLLLSIIFLSSWIAPFSSAQARNLLSGQTALYGRLVRLSHNTQPSLNGKIVATVTAFPNGVGEEDVYSSSDGLTFTRIGAIKDNDFAGGLCCGTLYELPQRTGNLPAGTLLWAGSVGQSSSTNPMQLKIYESSDGGATWSYLSNCATAAKPKNQVGGLWEPQFTVAADGALVCFYSDETQSGHSQVIRQTRSYDGLTWQAASNTIASTNPADRPGMPVVTVLPSGSYFMTNELCGSAACAVYSRTSQDGWNWGDPANMGTRIVSASGQYFEHAPTNAWAPSASSANGTIFVTAQMMLESNGAVSSGNGATIFYSHSADGSGPWSTMPSPVSVPDAYDNYCPNYSSPLLPTADGQSLLEFASDYASGTCVMYFGTAPILTGTLSTSVTVTPAQTSVTTLPLAVTVSVVSQGNSTLPTGTVKLIGGSWNSGAVNLNQGAASFSIPQGALSAGIQTLKATYSGDANYAANTGSVTVSVATSAVPAFQLGAASLTLNAGAITGNTSTITVTPLAGFLGSVNLKATVTSGPAGATQIPSLSFGQTNPVSITTSASGTAILTISTSAPTVSSYRRTEMHGRNTGEPIALAGLFFLGIGGVRRASRRFHARRSAAIFCCILSVALVSTMGCGGAAASSPKIVAGTSTGDYVVTVTGSSGNIDATTTISLTVK